MRTELRRLVSLALLLSHCCGCGREEVVPHDVDAPTDGTATGIADTLLPAAPLPVRHVVTAPDRYDMPDIMGSGCALLDFDRDGLLDVFVVSGAADDAVATSSVLLHQTAPWQFETMPLPDSDESGGRGVGVTVGDFNNDGWPDLYVSRFGADRLLLNSGGQDNQPAFLDVTAQASINNLRWGTSVCCVDFDRDGWLDIFVTNYVDYVPQECVQLSGGNRDFCGPHRFGSTPDRLFRNVTGEQPADEGPVVFQDVSLDSGIAELSNAGLGVVAADFSDDGWPDLYVANDQQPNFLWINQQDGTFQEQAVLQGCACDVLGAAQASMGVVVYDFTGDDRFDLLLTHLDGERNTLYARLPSGGFRDISATWEPGQHSLPLTGFGVACLEGDAPGSFDLIVANGRVRRPDGMTRVVADFWQPYEQPDVLYRCRLPEPAGNGSACETRVLSESAGTISRGLATGDLDGDGDPDVLLTSVADRPRVFQNNSTPPDTTGLLRVRAIEPQHGGRDALGAVVAAITETRRSSRLVQTAGGYLSASEPVACFRFQRDDPPRELRVVWPDGTRERFAVRNSDLMQRLEHGTGQTED